MNTKEYVMIPAEGNEIPVKYMVMEVTVGANLAGSNVWLKVAAHGFETIAKFNLYLASIESNSGDVSPVIDGIEGTIGDYSVVALSTVAAYKTPASHHVGPYLIG